MTLLSVFEQCRAFSDGTEDNAKKDDITNMVSSISHPLTPGTELIGTIGRILYSQYLVPTITTGLPSLSLLLMTDGSDDLLTALDLPETDTGRCDALPLKVSISPSTYVIS